MNHLFDLWPFWLAIPLVLGFFLWRVDRPFAFSRLSHLEWSALSIVACICAGTVLFFQREPWFGMAQTQRAGLYAPAVATILSGLVVVGAAFIRYRREQAHPPA